MVRRYVSGLADTGWVGAGSFLAREYGYSPVAARRLTMRAVMVDQGVGSELRIALVDGGTVWGGLVLLRPQGVRPFSADEAATAQRLGRDVVVAMRRYACQAPPEPSKVGLPPGVLLVGDDEKVVAATSSARAWMGELGTTSDALVLPMESTVWNLTQAVRGTDGGVVTRVPTRRGWILLRAQAMATGDGVAVTIQPAVGGELLAALALWHGLTPRERAVVEQVVEGLAAKQIARRLAISPHTVNDHLKSIYRKLGVSAREELVARLIG